MSVVWHLVLAFLVSLPHGDLSPHPTAISCISDNKSDISQYLTCLHSCLVLEMSLWWGFSCNAVPVFSFSDGGCKESTGSEPEKLVPCWSWNLTSPDARTGYIRSEVWDCFTNQNAVTDTVKLIWLWEKYGKKNGLQHPAAVVWRGHCLPVLCDTRATFNVLEFAIRQTGFTTVFNWI